jgi:hypothetical protein
VFEQESSGVGPHCSFCGTSTGPFQAVEVLFTVLMCARCQADRRQASPAEVLAGHDPGEPWLQLACPIQGCSHRVIGPWNWRITAAEPPGWVATYELLRPYPNQLQRVVYRQVEDPPAT